MKKKFLNYKVLLYKLKNYIQIYFKVKIIITTFNHKIIKPKQLHNYIKNLFFGFFYGPKYLNIKIMLIIFS